MPLFTKDMILYKGNPKESARKKKKEMLVLIHKFNKDAGCKIILKNQLHFYPVV